MKKLKKLFVIILLVIIAIACMIVVQGYRMYKQALDEISLEERVNIIRTQANYTKNTEIPEIYKKAVIAVEDHRFYEHHGVDFISICRAVFNDIKTMSFVEGGSTITQQLAKNMFFTQEKKLSRKVAEVFMSREIEKNYNKDEILELYINTIYYGNGYYDIKSASIGYFGKLPKYLSDSEAIMLVGIPNAPSVYNPKINPELAEQRKKQVIQKMKDYGNLSEEEANRILNEKSF